MRLFVITIILHHRCAILSILILFKTTRPRAYVASSTEALVMTSCFAKRDQHGNQSCFGQFCYYKYFFISGINEGAYHVY